MTYYAVVRSNEYLEHHGIKGQKWYVRRFQNENGTLTPAGRERYGVKRYRKEAVKFQKKLDKVAQRGERDEYFREARTIPEGTIMYRTTPGKTDDKNPNKSVYVSYLTPDRNHYNQGDWILSREVYDLQQAGKKNITFKDLSQYEHKYTLEKDLKIPSRKEVEEVIYDSVYKDKNLYRKAITQYVEAADVWAKKSRGLEGHDKYIKDAVDKIIDNNKSASVSTVSFQVSTVLGGLPDVKNKIIKELSKRGYNAMTDEFSVGGRHGLAVTGMDPLIIFDKSVLKETGVRSTLHEYSPSEYSTYKNWKRKAQRYNDQGNEW